MAASCMCTAQVNEPPATTGVVRKPVVTLTALGRFAGDRVALADISLVIRSAEIRGLLGPNGSVYGPLPTC